MKKRLFCLLLTFVLISTICGCSVKDSKIRIGTAGIGGVYNEFGNVFSQILSDEKIMDIDVKATTGSAANVRLLSEGYIELALSQADIIDDAYFQKGTFENKYSNYSAVASLYTEAIHIIVRSNSDITSINDLLNKTVCVGEEESGTEKNSYNILSAYGISKEMITPVNYNYSDATEKLSSGNIDAMFCTSGINSSAIIQLASNCNIRFLDINDDAKQKIKSSHQFYTDYIIPSNTYYGQKDDVQTLGIKSVLLASNKLSDDKVEIITKALFDNSEKLKYSVSGFQKVDAASATNGITIPFHNGAVKYYESINISVKSAQ